MSNDPATMAAKVAYLNELKLEIYRMTVGEAKKRMPMDPNRKRMQTLMAREHFDGVPDHAERENMRARFEIARVAKKQRAK